MYERGYRSLGRYVLVLVGIPVVYLVFRASVGYVSGPTLHEGDRLESRTCRQCAGSAKNDDPELAPHLGNRCPFCAGRGKVDVIVPGPSRPTRVWGSVVDLAATGGEYSWSNPGNIRMLPLQAAMMPPELSTILGALPGSKVVFQREGKKTIELETSTGGRFSTPLAPGFWTVTASHDGFATHQGTIEVAPLTEPIWLEKATLIQEVEPDQARSENGLSLLIALTRPGKKGSFARLEAAHR